VRPQNCRIQVSDRSHDIHPTSKTHGIFVWMRVLSLPPFSFHPDDDDLVANGKSQKHTAETRGAVADAD